MDTNISQPNQMAATPSAEASQSTATGKILIVEDDVFLGRVLSGQMKDAHMEVTCHSSGEDALEYMKSNIPDLVIMDIFLPGMNGLDVLDAMRNDPRTKLTPVLVVSNTDEAKDRERAKGLGARFLIKAATSPDDIVAAVEETLKAANPSVAPVI